MYRICALPITPGTFYKRKGSIMPLSLKARKTPGGLRALLSWLVRASPARS
jgi:hypothetical protein